MPVFAFLGVDFLTAFFAATVLGFALVCLAPALVLVDVFFERTFTLDFAAFFDSLFTPRFGNLVDADFWVTFLAPLALALTALGFFEFFFVVAAVFVVRFPELLTVVS